MLIYSFLLFIAFFLAFRYIKAFNISSLNQWVIPFGFLIKVLAGLFFLYIYSVHYGRGALSADAGAFLKESKIVNQVFFQSPTDYLKLLTGIGETDELVHTYLSKTHHWDVGNLTIINDSKNVLRVHSLIHFISFGNAFVHLLFMCFVSLMGVIHLHKTFESFSEIKPVFFFLSILLIPSTLFWTSGILKEPLMFLGFALIVRGTLDPDLKWRKWIFVSTGLFLMLLFKPYVLACLIPSGAFLFVFLKIAKKRLLLSIGISLLTVLAIVLIFPSTEKTITTYLSRKQFDFENVGKGGLHALDDTCFYYFTTDQLDYLKIDSGKVELLRPVDAYIIFFGSVTEPIPVHLKPNGDKWQITYHSIGCKSYIKTTLIENSTTQLLKNIPQALINSLFRPFPKDPGSWLKYPAMIELWAIFMFLGYCIYQKRHLNQIEKGIIASLLIFALSLFLLIGWTTPVIGAIARYRFPAQLALVIIGLILIIPPQLFKR